MDSSVRKAAVDLLLQHSCWDEKTVEDMPDEEIHLWLGDIVSDAKLEEASRIGDKGVEAQIEFLQKFVW